MTGSEITPVVLAAGEGKRMRSALPKVLHPVLGRPMLDYVLVALEEANLSRPIVVVGHNSEAIEAAFPSRARFVRQAEPRGTGDAVLAALPLVEDGQRVLVLYGDMPCVSTATLVSFIEAAQGSRAAILSARFADPTGYGRVIRDEAGRFAAVREHRDASSEERRLDEINSGIYLFEVEDLRDYLEGVGTDNAQGEAYLPELLGILRSRGMAVRIVEAGCPDEVRGVNDRIQLAEAEGVLRWRILRRWMEAGVTVRDPSSVWIEPGVELEADVTIEAGCRLLGRTRVRRGAVIGPDTGLRDVEVGEGAVVERSEVEASRIGRDVHVGPFSHLRPGCEVGDGAEIGNYAELKNTRFGAGSKAHHHSYLGDAIVGKHVNIGAGAITVNYDGRTKETTVIGDGAFIGCNVNLIAPVTVGPGAYVAAGSTVNHEVPAEALAIARERQRNIEGWVRRRRQRGE